MISLESFRLKSIFLFISFMQSIIGYRESPFLSRLLCSLLYASKICFPSLQHRLSIFVVVFLLLVLILVVKIKMDDNN